MKRTSTTTNSAKARKKHRHGYVMVERRRIAALAEKVKGLVDAGSADARSLSTDVAQLL